MLMKLVSYMLIITSIALSLKGQGPVEVLNVNTPYDLCCMFTNATGNQVVHVGPQGYATLDNIAGILTLAILQNQPTCSNIDDYIGLSTILNGTIVNKIVTQAGYNARPIFIIGTQQQKN